MDEITTIITMLERRGGELDKKAVKLIKGLDAHGEIMADRLRLVESAMEEMQRELVDARDFRDDAWAEGEIKQRGKSIEALTGQNEILADQLAQSRAEIERLELLVVMSGGETHAALKAENDELKAKLWIMQGRELILEDVVVDSSGPMLKIKGIGLDEPSVRGAFQELGEVSEKLAKVLGRELRDEDTPLLLCAEVDREMLKAKMTAAVRKVLEDHGDEVRASWSAIYDRPKK